MKRLIIANWKMNPVDVARAKEKFQKIRDVSRGLRRVQTVVCPAFVFLEPLSKLVTGLPCVLGAQDVFWKDQGAYTGEISPRMLDSLDIHFVVLGHSERRALGETDEVINKKIKACIRNNLKAVLCVGETERDSQGEYFKLLRHEIRNSLVKLSQKDLKNLVVAYEPVWAIGAMAKHADTPEALTEMVIFIRKVLSDQFGKFSAMQVPILYGGSADDQNAGAFLARGNVQGLLVGRASLDPKIFNTILRIADKLK